MKRQAGFGTIYLVLGAVMLAMAGGFYLYYKDSQATIAELTAKNVALNIQVEEDKLIIAQAKEDAELQKTINDAVNKQFAESRKAIEDLRKKFNKRNEITGKTRDIGKLAINSPKAIAKIITNGTKEAFRCIEIASGAELTDDEIAAEKRSQINDACTQIANPNYIHH